MAGLVGSETYSTRTRERLRYIAQRSIVGVALLIIATIVVAAATTLSDIGLLVMFVVGAAAISIVVTRNVDARFPATR
jgi:hypothetical protein